MRAGVHAERDEIIAHRRRAALRLEREAVFGRAPLFSSQCPETRMLVCVHFSSHVAS